MQQKVAHDFRYDPRRLKKAYGPRAEVLTPASKEKVSKLRRNKQVANKSRNQEHSEDEANEQGRSNSRIDNEVESGAEGEKEKDEIHSPSLVMPGQYDPDWDQGSSYLQTKLRADSNSKEVTYQLRTRPVCGSEREVRREEPSSVANSQDDRETTPDMQIATHFKSSDQTITTAGHSYNLRSRTVST